MALNLKKITAGALPVVEVPIPILKGDPAGDSVMVQLISRAERLKIYPDEPDERTKELNQKHAAGTAKLRRTLADLALQRKDLQAKIDLEPDRKKAKELQAQKDALENSADMVAETTELKSIKKEIDHINRGAMVQLFAACVTDETGEKLTKEQAAEIFENNNEKVLEQILNGILVAHGLKLEGSDQGET